MPSGKAKGEKDKRLKFKEERLEDKIKDKRKKTKDKIKEKSKM
jgi:hypothetical protein